MKLPEELNETFDDRARLYWRFWRAEPDWELWLWSGPVVCAKLTAPASRHGRALRRMFKRARSLMTAEGIVDDVTLHVHPMTVLNCPSSELNTLDGLLGSPSECLESLRWRTQFPGSPRPHLPTCSTRST
jgi:hypothetical protein